MRIFIVRHGETEANVGRILQGHRGVTLNDTGRRQARALANRLQSEAVDACFSSDLLRARETAEIVLEGRNVPIHLRRELRERSYGEFEGRFVDEYTEGLALSGVSRELYRPVGGENYSDMQGRIVPFWEELVADHHRASILLVGHSGINQVLLRHLLGTGEEAQLEQSNACLNILELDEGARVTPVTMNCTLHLAAVGIEPAGHYG